MGGDVARNTEGRVLKVKLWPSLYQASVPIWNPKAHTEKGQPFWFLLLHEVLGVMARIGVEETVLDRSACDPQTAEHITFCDGLARRPRSGLVSGATVSHGVGAAPVSSSCFR